MTLVGGFAFQEAIIDALLNRNEPHFEYAALQSSLTLFVSLSPVGPYIPICSRCCTSAARAELEPLARSTRRDVHLVTNGKICL